MVRSRSRFRSSNPSPPGYRGLVACARPTPRASSRTFCDPSPDEPVRPRGTVLGRPWRRTDGCLVGRNRVGFWLTQIAGLARADCRNAFQFPIHGYRAGRDRHGLRNLRAKLLGALGRQCSRFLWHWTTGNFASLAILRPSSLSSPSAMATFRLTILWSRASGLGCVNSFWGPNRPRDARASEDWPSVRVKVRDRGGSRTILDA
jgi:hypothetical protein